MIKVVVLLFLVSVFGNSSLAYEQDVKKKNAEQLPEQMRGIGIDTHLGDQVDLSLKFRNEAGELITLQSLFDKGRPVVFSMVYYSCTSLCNFHLNGIVDTLKKMQWQPGKEFEIVAVSIDPKESSNLAAAKKETYMESYGRKESTDGWHFLTGDQASISALTKQLGFKYKWIESRKEWAHASAAIVTSPKGVITRYLNGIVFDPRDMKLAITEAAAGKIGTIVDQLLLYCFRFDPEKNKYALYAFNVMRAGGGITVLFLLMLFVPMWLRSKRTTT